MRNLLLILMLLFSMISSGQWSTFNTGVGKNITRIFSFSSSESFLLCQNKVLKSNDTGQSWAPIFSDTGFNFIYVYRYNDDSLLFNCIHEFSITNYGEKIYRVYKNNVIKMIDYFTASTIESNVYKFNNDTFLNIFNNVKGGYLGVLINQYSFNPDVIPYPQSYVYIVYYINYAKLQNYQLLDDTIVTLSNRVDYYANEYYPIINRNNIRNWSNDTFKQVEMKNLTSSRGFWAFTADNMILLGENYIALLSDYPILKSLKYYPDFSFKKILFTTRDTGYIVGRNITNNRGVMLRSTDGGISWKEQELNNCPQINDIGLIGTHTLIATCDSGIILRTENGGGKNVGIEEQPNIDFNRMILCPNPAHDIVYINNPEMEIVTVFNSLGMPVLSTLENKFNIEALPQGVYFVRCGNSTGKLIIK